MIYFLFSNTTESANGFIGILLQSCVVTRYSNMCVTIRNLHSCLYAHSPQWGNLGSERPYTGKIAADSFSRGLLKVHKHEIILNFFDLNQIL
jgi:hypothetical protein